MYGAEVYWDDRDKFVDYEQKKLDTYYLSALDPRNDDPLNDDAEQDDPFEDGDDE